MKKLKNFIIENQDIIISNYQSFSKNTLEVFQEIINGRKKIPNDFKLLEVEEQLLINIFINSNLSFDEFTPDFIIKNPLCIKSAVLRNINSIKYLYEAALDYQLKEFITSECLKQDYVLSNDSPLYLKSNFEVSRNSVKLNIKSADYINWYLLDLEDKNHEKTRQLVKEIIGLGYQLTSKSHRFLKEDEEVVLVAIISDIKNLKYASPLTKWKKKVFNYLLMNGYEFTDSQIITLPLVCFLNHVVLKETFKRFNLYGSNDLKYQERFTKLYYDALNSKPLIKNFESIFQYMAEISWEDYRKVNSDFYNNIFGKICAELRNSNTLEDALFNLALIDEMKEILRKEEFDKISLAMEEYYRIYHSNAINKIEKLMPAKDLIATYASLYVSKSKDNYINEQILQYYQSLRNYYELKINNPLVYKQLILSKKKQIFCEKYQNNDPNIYNFLEKLINTYSSQSSPEDIRYLINEFLIHDKVKLLDVFPLPDCYYDYQRYKKACKLIIRLNHGYIQYNGVEVSNYQDIISFDYNSQMYIYTGKMFTENNLQDINDYQNKYQLFEKIKKAIMMEIQSLDLGDKIDEELKNNLITKLPFTDEYFEFKDKKILSGQGEICFKRLIDRTINDLNGFVSSSLTNDESYQKVYHLFIKQAIFWLLLIADNELLDELNELGINKENIIKIVNNMPNLIKLAEDFQLDLTNFKELLLVKQINEYTDASGVAILGRDIIEKLYMELGYKDDCEMVIRVAKELVCQMIRRNKSTVPYVSGKYLNYHYSLYDSQDVSVLTSGIDTDACFRISGFCHDFLHYCVLDKNGFVIKITDDFGNFIARAAGFRHGNCVFINQLRTIYDCSGNNYDGQYECERQDIIATFIKCCQDIVTTSQRNPQETKKIEFVFVTKSYSLDDVLGNVSVSVTEKIGSSPMDTRSEDWTYFLENTSNLEKCSICGYFETDYGNYPLICVASTKKITDIKPRDIKKRNVPALYERKRSRVIVTNKNCQEVVRIINRINAIACFFQEITFNVIEIPDESYIITGDNWYIIFNQHEIINSCCLEWDIYAKREFQTSMQLLHEYQLENKDLTNDFLAKKLLTLKKTNKE